jgi:hypothetical protein
MTGNYLTGWATIRSSRKIIFHGNKCAIISTYTKNTSGIKTYNFWRQYPMHVKEIARNKHMDWYICRCSKIGHAAIIMQCLSLQMVSKTIALDCTPLFLCRLHRVNLLLFISIRAVGSSWTKHVIVSSSNNNLSRSVPFKYMYNIFY